MNTMGTFARILLATMLLLATVATAAVAAPGGGKTTGKQPGTTVTLRSMTYNIHYGVGTDGVLDLERIAQVIEANDVDVVGLQEVDRHFGDRSAWQDQATWLADRLGMHLAYGPAVDQPPVVAGDPRRQTGNAVLSRFPIAAANNVMLPYTSSPRAALDTTIDVNGTPVRFISTHLVSGINPDERELQTEALADMVGRKATRTVLVGDFNALDWHAEMRPIYRVLDDAWKSLRLKSDGSTHPSLNPIYRIDYVFSSSDTPATAASVVPSLASDHLPVVVDLDVTP